MPFPLRRAAGAVLLILSTASHADVAQRAQALLDAMTLKEKSALLYGYGSKVVDGQHWQVYVKGNPRLGIPDMTQGDAPSGLMIGSRQVTQMPASVALAATFSPAVAQAYGEVIGSETRALGYGVIHGPNVDVLRDPRHGRAHESFGEDPVLVSAMATAYVQGVQRHQVLADAKHFAVNTVEQDRLQVDARIDARTLNELYLAPFQDVVEDGHVAMVMCAYNKINGVHACDDRSLIHDLLRQRWGFTGIVRTDAGAHHGLASLRNGVDQEFRVADQYGDRLLAAVRAGTFPEAAVDQAVLHILQTMMRYGIFDNPPTRTGADLKADAAKAQEVAERSIVLLKNSHDVLPLSPNIASLALIGASADDTLTAGGPANPAPGGKDTVLQALRQRLPTTRITYQAGTDPVSPASLAAGFAPLPQAMLKDLSARYDNGVQRNDAGLSFTPMRGFQDMALSSVAHYQWPPEKARSVTWQGELHISQTGEYGLDLVGQGRAHWQLDGQPVLTLDAAQPGSRVYRRLLLDAGDHRLQLTYDKGTTDGQLKVGLQPPPGVLDARMAAAVEAARQADVAVVVARDLASEANDRPGLGLPNDQDRLIAAVAAANPRTVVVLTTGSAVTLPWQAQVPALLEAWYGGTRGGAAIARVLLGDVNPGGRLPVSFPASEGDLATSPLSSFPGVKAVALYPEGLATGYRHYNRSGGPAAAYPFGYGLSYTRFAYRDLRINREHFTVGAPVADGTYKGVPAVQVSVTVQNTGARAGSVVPQLYLGFPLAAQVPAPLLKGFDSVYLKPGQSREVTFTLDQRAFSTYDAQRQAWQVVPGRYTVKVGDNAGDLPLNLAVHAFAP
ncbi:glycoside hydrolase family 3 protein [Pseudomonas putida]